jgi:type IV secretion system protein VirD4
VGSFGDAVRKAVGSIRDDVQQAKVGAAGRAGRGVQGQQAQQLQIVPSLAMEPDPYPWLLSTHAGDRGRLHRLLMGTNGRGDFIYTDERRNLLMLGPPRSDKTAGVLVPLILTAPGPVVSTSTKDDVLRATGLARARLGTIWHYGPDGSPPPPGTKPLRWSPIPPSRDWSTAQGLAKAISDSSRKSSDRGGGGSDASAFFGNRAAAFIAAVLHAAAIADRPMQWVLRATAGNEKVVEEAVDILNDAIGSEASLAADSLQGIIDQDPRTKTNIYATAEVAFSVYRLPGALRTTEDPNFDPAKFVAGDPDGTNVHRAIWYSDRTPPEINARMEEWIEWGSYDTVYITASGTQQNLVAPLVAGLLTQIREAVYTQHRQDDAAGYYGRPPVVWALDELASLPMQDLPETLTQSGSQGLLIAACLQDLGLVERKWDTNPESFLTLFGDIVIHPGIRDTKTLEAISTIVGKQWVTVSSTSSNQGYTRGRDNSSTEGWQQSVNQQLLPILEPGLISRGPGDHPDRVLHLRGQRWGWAFSMPYWKAPPWPQLLVGTMDYSSKPHAIEGKFEIPPPELDLARNGQALLHAGGPQLQIRHHHALQGLDGFRQRRRQFVAFKQQHPLLRDYDDFGGISPMKVEMWLLSPYLVQYEEFARIAARWGWAVNTDRNEWLPFTDPQGSTLWAQVDWLISVDTFKVQLHWQNPADRQAVLMSGTKWSDCWLLDQYALQKNLPGLMLQGWARSSAGFAVLYDFGMKLAEEFPIALVMNEQTMHCAGNWEPYGGPPNFEAALAAFPAPEPEPPPPRPFFIGDQAYAEYVFTKEDHENGTLDRKITNMLRETGNLPPEDYR